MRFRHAAVSGGTGFIGRRLVQSLRTRDIGVVVFTRQAQVSAPIPGVRYVKLDVADPAAIRELPPPFDTDHVFFHLSSDIVWANDFSAQAFASFKEQVMGPLLLLKALGSGLRRVVLGSSIMVYPLVHDQPLVENRDEQPPNFYGVNKLVLEHALACWSNGKPGSSWAGLRIGQVYGHEMRVNRFLPDAMDRALANEPIPVFGDGSATADWVYVEDVVKGLLLAADSESFGVFNLASGQGSSNLDIVRTIVSVSCSRSLIELKPDRPMAPRRQLVSLERTRRVLGYQPRYDLFSGTAAMIDERKGSGR